MGAWGADSFENDDAMDWVADLETSAGWGVVRAALEAAAGGAGYLEAPVGSVALAAAEVVAAARGRAAEGLPEEVRAWVGAAPEAPDDALVRRAVEALEAVENPSRSELRELWDESAPGDENVWRAAVADLRAQLS